MENSSKKIVLPPLPNKPDGLIAFGSYRKDEERSCAGKTSKPRKFISGTILRQRKTKYSEVNNEFLIEF